MKKLMLILAIVCSALVTKAQDIELSQMVKSLYCKDVSCLDSVLVGYGYRKINTTTKTDGKYTLYKAQNWDKEKTPSGQNEVNYIITNKGEVIISLTTYDAGLADIAKRDLGLPSLKFTFVETNKLSDTSFVHTYTSEKHPKVIVSYKMELFLERGENQYTISAKLTK